jgi:GT2 family glycosyltransferase
MADIWGFLDAIVDGHAMGWAINRQDPSERLVVTILVDGKVAGEAVASRLRGDLLDAGYGDGQYAFKIPLPTSLSPGQHVAEAQIRGAALRKSPLSFEWSGAPSPSQIPEDNFAGGVQSVLVFARMLGLEAMEVLPFALAGLQAPEAATHPWFDTRDYSTLHIRFAGSEVNVEDVWFTRTNTLRFRIASPSSDPGLRAPAVLRILQRQEDGSAQPLSLAEHTLSADGLTFVDVDVSNPYMPLLIVAQTGEGRFLGTTLLPFPSLCRGGAHFGEMLAIADHPGYLASLTGVSDALVREYAGSNAGTGFALSRIEVDLQGATGAEPIFSPALLAWLAGVAHLQIVAVGPPPGMDSALQTHLCTTLQGIPLAEATQQRIAERQAQGAAILRIPADAIPTVSVAFSRRLRVPSGTAGTSYVISEAPGGKPVWSVSLPPLTEELLALQPRDRMLGFPHLSQTGNDQSRGRSGGEGRDLPLAVRFRGGETEHEAAVLRPVAPDNPQPILRTVLNSAERDAATVSVLLASHIAPEAVALFLGSLALQTLAGQVDVIAATRAEKSARSEALARVLEEHFPGPQQTVDASGMGEAGEFNALAAAARGRYLLVVNEQILLQDTRILETLATLMRERTASASCVLMREGVFRKGTSLSFHSGGFYPSHVSFLSAPHLVFSEPNGHAALPYATFPVFGNPFRLVLLRAAVWTEVGGLKAEDFPVEHYDIDFALRTSHAGYHHLCTSAVTATSTENKGGQERLDPVALHFLPYGRWEDIFASSTILRELRV